MRPEIEENFTAKILDHYPDQRVELLDGQLVFSPPPTSGHGVAQTAIAAEIFGRFRGNGPPGGEGWWIMTEIDVAYGPRTVCRHDLGGWRKSRYPRPLEPNRPRVLERPDWVCEILSPSNARNDTVEKRRLLHGFGVPHYWIVNPARKTLLVLRWGQEDWHELPVLAAGHVGRVEPFDAVEIEVARLFGDA